MIQLHNVKMIPADTQTDSRARREAIVFWPKSPLSPEFGGEAVDEVRPFGGAKRATITQSDGFLLAELIRRRGGQREM
jgi:hypothetical protein